MNKTFLRLGLLSGLALVGGVIVLVARVDAGAPLVCVEWEVGDEPVLEFGTQPFQPHPDLAVEDVPGRAVICLDRTDSVIAHMETIRRAMLSVKRAKGNADGMYRLVLFLYDRALQSRDAEDRRYLLLFDLGYALQTAHQFREMNELEGFGYIEAAIALRPDVPELAFAAAVCCTLGGPREKEMLYLKTAVSAAGEGSLLERNLVRFCGEERIAAIRRSGRGPVTK